MIGELAESCPEFRRNCYVCGGPISDGCDCEANTQPQSIIQPWVTYLGLRIQGVLITAIRGCDGEIKEDVSKPIQRELRGLVLVPFDKRELHYAKGFMVAFPSHVATSAFESFRRSVDHYPVHYLFHLLHAMEIVGYCHPQANVREVYVDRYRQIVQKLHLNPETKEQLFARLSEDRIEKGTVES